MLHTLWIHNFSSILANYNSIIDVRTHKTSLPQRGRGTAEAVDEEIIISPNKTKKLNYNYCKTKVPKPECEEIKIKI